MTESNNSLQDIPPSASTKEVALRLFHSRGDLVKHRTSNTIGFYDSMPKYARKGSQPYSVTDPKEAVRTFSYNHEGVQYIIEVEAARLKNADGETLYYFPSSREEIIEDVLRHLMMANQQLSFFDDNVGCQFTIYMIRKELERYGKTRSNADIRHSLKMLRKANLSVYRAVDYNDGMGDPIFSGPFFADATVINLNDYFERGEIEDENKAIKGLVKFHNMVSAGIREISFRLLQYDICMQYKNDMARWLHKRISHRHTGADKNTPYTIKMSTIYNDGNWLWTNRVDKMKGRVVAALKEMIELGQVEEKTLDHFKKTNKKGVAEDYYITIFLSREFIDHIVISNTIHRENITIYKQYSDNPLLIKEPSKEELIEVLKKHGVFHPEKLVKKYPLTRIQANIDYTFTYIALKREKNPDAEINTASMLYKAITDNWAAQTSLSRAPVAQTVEISPDPDKLKGFDEKTQAIVKKLWPTWDLGTQKTFNNYGNRSPYIVDLLKN